MNSCVLDASALLALFNMENGHDVVAHLLPHSIMSAVNVAEVIGELDGKLSNLSAAKDVVYKAINKVIPFDFEQAARNGALKKLTKPLGLSLGDRACIVLGQMLNIPIYTADKAWSKLDVNCKIIQIR